MYEFVVFVYIVSFLGEEAYVKLRVCDSLQVGNWVQTSSGIRILS